MKELQIELVVLPGQDWLAGNSEVVQEHPFVQESPKQKMKDISVYNCKTKLHPHIVD
jgi:hypothetical protein